MKPNFVKLKKKQSRNWKEDKEFQRDKKKQGHRPRHVRVDPWIESVDS